MKITKQQLKRIIKEEISILREELSDATGARRPGTDMAKHKKLQRKWSRAVTKCRGDDACEEKAWDEYQWSYFTDEEKETLRNGGCVKLKYYDFFVKKWATDFYGNCEPPTTK
jgi:hypothetical protein